MLYAKYHADRRRWIIGYNPEIGGYKGSNKQAIWKQIRRNASFMHDMVKHGCVCMTVYAPNGKDRKLVTVFKDGQIDTFVIKAA